MKPRIVGIGDWNLMVDAFESESDRRVAILAGSFAKHALGTFLTHSVSDKKVAEKLFGPVGPLSSFSQRIAVAYAFGLITRAQYEDFEIIRQIRKHFAHHPLQASFSSPDVQKFLSGLSWYGDPENNGGPHNHRTAYLITCGLVSRRLLDQVEREEREKGEQGPGESGRYRRRAD